MPRPLPLILAATTSLAFGATPAAASIAQIGADGYLDVTETTSGEKNDLYIKVLSQGGATILEFTDLGNITAGNGCWTASFGAVQCSDPPQFVRIALGGGDDKFGVSEVGTTLSPSGGVSADLGPGNDIYDASVTNATIAVSGGEGNDRFEGSLRRDILDGGPGNDEFFGGPGEDEIHGGPGDDRLQGDSGSKAGVHADVLDGGEGRDTLRDYFFDGDPPQAPAISITLDDAANDGRQGENDNVSGIEVFEPYSAGSFTGSEGDDDFTAPEVGAAGTLLGKGGNDRLTAGDAHGDVVDGGAGDDTLDGGFGDDRLVGGPGKDRVSGDRASRCNEMHCDYLVSGNDTIEVRDGEVDSVTCGPGTDRVIADAADTVAADCENVERAAVNGGGDGGGNGSGNGNGSGSGGGTKAVTLTVVKARLGAVLKRGLRVRVENASGTVRLTAKRGTKVMAKGNASAKGGKATVRLKFTAQARRTLRRAKKVSLRITGAGATARVVTLKR
jgi:Ca2+-binding RTX toxin-like protein